MKENKVPKLVPIDVWQIVDDFFSQKETKQTKQKNI